MKKLLFIALAALSAPLYAQELNCKVQVISPSLQTSASDKQALEQLQQTLTEFMNNTRWTGETFKDNEKIECNILINISEQPAVDEYGGTMQVTSRRPVFNSSYSTTILNYVDDNCKFRYERGAALLFSIDQHRSNLTSMLAFYAYMIIAYDYDTFSPEGGSRYFVRAQQIVNNAQGAAEPGWKAFEGDRNRYWLVDNAQQSVFKPLRSAFYNYHRNGFDRMYDNFVEGRKSVILALNEILEVHKTRPGSFNIQLFFSTKANELIDLFSQATAEEKQQVFNLCKQMDPANLNRYQRIMNAK